MQTGKTLIDRRLRAYRAQIHRTQSEVAAEMGTTQNGLHRAGNNLRISPEIFLALIAHQAPYDQLNRSWLMASGNSKIIG